MSKQSCYLLLTDNFKKRFEIVVSYSKTNKFIQLLGIQPNFKTNYSQSLDKSFKSRNVLLNTNQPTLKFTAFHPNEMSEGNIYHQVYMHLIPFPWFSGTSVAH